jgi:hypothetical protein
MILSPFQWVTFMMATTAVVLHSVLYRRQESHKLLNLPMLFYVGTTSVFYAIVGVLRALGYNNDFEFWSSLLRFQAVGTIVVMAVYRYVDMRREQKEK